MPMQSTPFRPQSQGPYTGASGRVPHADKVSNGLSGSYTGMQLKQNIKLANIQKPGGGEGARTADRRLPSGGQQAGPLSLYHINLAALWMDTLRKEYKRG